MQMQNPDDMAITLDRFLTTHRIAARKEERQEQRLERETGIEPATSSLGSLRSTAELLPLPRQF